MEGDGVSPGLATEWTVTFPAEVDAGLQVPSLAGVLAATAKLGLLTSHLNLGGALEPRVGTSGGATGALLWDASG